MKKVIAILMGMISFSIYAQLSESQLDIVQFKADSAASLLHEKLLRQEKTLLETTFTVDTFTVEIKMSMKMKMDTSKIEHAIAINDAEIEYDDLLTKYYKILLSIHDSKSQKSLVDAQKKWIKYRDEEIAMTEKFYAEQIAKSTTEEKAKAKAAEHLELTKERVVELYKHILASPAKKK